MPNYNTTYIQPLLCIQTHFLCCSSTLKTEKPCFLPLHSHTAAIVTQCSAEEARRGNRGRCDFFFCKNAALCKSGNRVLAEHFKGEGWATCGDGFLQLFFGNCRTCAEDGDGDKNFSKKWKGEAHSIFEAKLYLTSLKEAFFAQCFPFPPPPKIIRKRFDQVQFLLTAILTRTTASAQIATSNPTPCWFGKCSSSCPLPLSPIFLSPRHSKRGGESFEWKQGRKGVWSPPAWAGPQH